MTNLFGQLGTAVALELASGREPITSALLLRMAVAVLLGLLGGVLVQDRSPPVPSAAHQTLKEASGAGKGTACTETDAPRLARWLRGRSSGLSETFARLTKALL